LKTLDLGPNHGFGIAQHVVESSGGLLRVEEGSLYPALHRLERQKMVAASWKVTDHGRRAKIYSITPAGKKRLGELRTNWKNVAKGVKKVLKSA
jgi:transcriptional regulator